MNRCTLVTVPLLFLFLISAPASASNLDCEIAHRRCQLDASKSGPKTPCDKYMECEALALCELSYCVCRRAGSGHLGGFGEVDPALEAEARTICGMTHSRVGKCENIARKCSDFREAQHAAQQHQSGSQHHGGQGSSHSHKPKPKPERPDRDDCNPNFDPNNLKGRDDRPCIR